MKNHLQASTISQVCHSYKKFKFVSEGFVNTETKFLAIPCRNAMINPYDFCVCACRSLLYKHDICIFCGDDNIWEKVV